MKKNVVVVLAVLGVVLLLTGAAYFIWRNVLGHKDVFLTKSAGMAIGATIESAGESQSISSSGGNLALAMQSGDSTNLIIPDKALAAAEKISLKEITALDGAPKGLEFVAGVEVGPDGAWLDQPAEIQITIPSDKLEANLVGFSFSTDGKDFQLYPIKISDNIATLQLVGFSGYGILELTEDNATPTPPTTIEKQAKQYIAAIVAEGKGVRQEIDYGKTTRIKNILTAWYKTSVKPNLSEATKSEDKIDAALHEFLSFKATLEFFGLDDDFSAEIENSYNDLASAIKNGSEKSFKACVVEKNPEKAAKLLRYKKIIELLGLDGRQSLKEADLDTMVQKCVNFKLTITSTITTTTAITTNVTESSGEGTILFQDGMQLAGSASVTTASDQTAGMPPCSPNVPEVWNITIPEFSLATSSTGPKFSLEMILDFPDDALVWTCPFTGGEGELTDHNPAWIFDVLHQDEIKSLNQADETITFLLPDWEISGKGGVFAEKVYTRSTPAPLGAGTFKENTTFKLIHTPKN